jgi:predicted PurR-regulated permease PerM
MRAKSRPQPAAQQQATIASAVGSPLKASNNGESKPAPRPLVIRPHITRICLVIIAVSVTIALLRWGEAFFVPLLLGIFTGYAFSPWVSALARLRIPRAIGAALTMCCVGAMVVGAVYSLREGAVEVTQQLPEAARKLRNLVGGQHTSTPLAQIHRAAKELDKAAAEATGAPAPQAVPASRAEGPAVASVEKLMLGVASSAVTVALELSLGGLIAYFLLAGGDSFRRKVISIAGPTLAQRRITVELLDDIDAQIQRALMVMLITNVLIALAIAALFAVMGVDRALMWGALAGILHIVPYIGAAVIAGAAGAIGLVNLGDVSQALTLAGCSLLICGLIGSGLSAVMLSNGTRMNSMVTLTGLLFFGWLWGAWGMLLGVPALAVIKAIADRASGLQPLAKLMAP